MIMRKYWDYTSFNCISFLIFLSNKESVFSLSLSNLFFSQIRKFVAKDSAGLRIRSHPSLQSEQIGIVKVNGTITFIDEIHNDDGVWLRLNEETIKKYVPNMNGYTEAWCLSFNQHLGKSLLVPVDVSEKWFLKASELHSLLTIDLSLIKAFQFWGNSYLCPLYFRSAWVLKGFSVMEVDLAGMRLLMLSVVGSNKLKLNILIPFKEVRNWNAYTSFSYLQCYLNESHPIFKKLELLCIQKLV